MATYQRIAAALALAISCTDPHLKELSLPRNVEDVRGRLLPYVEGHEISVARDFLARHGFACEEPLPSASDAHVQLCHPQGRSWVLEVYERRGRVADVQAR